MVLNKYVSLAPLPKQGTGVVEGLVCRVSGWGYNSLSGGQAPFTLRTVTVPIVSTARCNSSESFNGNITANMICAGYRTGGKDACKVQGTKAIWPSFTSVKQLLFYHYYLNICEVRCCTLMSNLPHCDKHDHLVFEKPLNPFWNNKFSKVPALVLSVYQIAHCHPLFISSH